MIRNNKKIIKNKKGFTLIELMISVSIIAMISTLYLTNYQGANKQSQLSLATQKLASDIRLAQNYSLGLLDYEGDIPDGGWGINLKKGNDYYTIFADSGDGFYAFDDVEEYRRVDLPNGVIIDSLVVGDIPDPESNLDIVFLPPDPITYINAIDDTKVEITLKNIENSVSKIEVNFFGLIDVLD